MKKFLIAFLLTFLATTAFAGDITRDKITAKDHVVLEDITAPSNAPTGHQRLYVDTTDSLVRIKDAAGAVLYLGTSKQNLSATTDPTANEDSGDGYAPGSLWVNVTADKVFINVDATVAAAIWKDLSTPGGSVAWTDLTDTPGSINSLQFVRGNSGGTALEFTTDIVQESDFSNNSLRIKIGSGAMTTLAVGDNTLVGRDATTGDGDLQALTKAETLTLLNVEDGAEVTSTSKVDSAGAVMESDMTNNTIRFKNSAGSTANIVPSDNTIICRDASTGDVEIQGCTAVETRTLLNVADGADITDASTVNAAGAVMETDFASNSLRFKNDGGTMGNIIISPSQLVGRASAGEVKNLTATEGRTLLNVENNADVTDATNVNSAGAVMESDFGNNSIQIRNNSATMENIVIADDNILCKDASTGEIDIQGCTIAETLTMLNVVSGADVTNAGSVDAAGAVMETDFTNSTLRFKNSGGSMANVTLGVNEVPIRAGAEIVPLPLGPNTILGRAGSNIEELTKTETLTLLNVEDGADVTDNAAVDAAGAIMDSEIADAEGFLRKTGAGAYVASKSNLAASTDPGASNDNTQGYVVGSMWINISLDKVWQAADVSTGAAVWRDLSTAAVGGSQWQDTGLWLVPNTSGDGMEVRDGTDADHFRISHDGTNGILSLNAGQFSFQDNIIFPSTQTVDGRDLSVDGTKLDGVETAADITDAANVVSSLDGATIANITVAGGDKVLVQDITDGDNLKTVTAQSIADLGAGGGGTVDTSGTPIALDYARFTDADTIEGRSFSEVRTDLNVEDNADVTDAANVNSAGAVMESDFTNNSVRVKANSGSMFSVVIGTSAFLGRQGGDLESITGTEARGILNVEDNADVTDEANVVSSLDGATIGNVTVAGGDKVLVQDITDSDNLKTVTAQSIADLGGGGGSLWVDNGAYTELIDTGQLVGIGPVAGTDGTLHVQSGSAGTVTASTVADEVVIESAGNGGISLLNPATSNGIIYFGDPGSATDGSIFYSHANDDFKFQMGGGVHYVTFNPAFTVFNEGGLNVDFRIESDLNDHMFFMDATNNSVHIDNNLLTGAGDGDLVMANNKTIRFIDSGGTTSANFGITGTSSNNMDFLVPDATDDFAFSFGGSFRLIHQLENTGAGIKFSGESSADHATPAAAELVMYTKDVSGDTKLFYRTDSEIVELGAGGGGGVDPISVVRNGRFTLFDKGSVTVISGYDLTAQGWLVRAIGVGQILASQELSQFPANYDGSTAGQFLNSTVDDSLASSDIYDWTQAYSGYEVSQFRQGFSDATGFTIKFDIRSAKTGVMSIGFLNAASNRSYVTTFTINTTNTWEEKSISITGDTTGTWNINLNHTLSVYFVMACGSNFDTSTLNSWTATANICSSTQLNFMATPVNGVINITNIQIVKGSTAPTYTAFSVTENDLRTGKYSRPVHNINCFADTTASVACSINFQPPMGTIPQTSHVCRAGASLRVLDASNLATEVTASSCAFTSIQASQHGLILKAANFSGLTDGGGYHLFFNATNTPIVIDGEFRN